MVSILKIIQRIAVASAAVTLSIGGAAHAGTTTYKYDVQGRVVEIDYPNGAIVKYTYDNAGNRTQVIKQAGS